MQEERRLIAVLLQDRQLEKVKFDRVDEVVRIEACLFVMLKIRDI